MRKISREFTCLKAPHMTFECVRFSREYCIYISTYISEKSLKGQQRSVSSKKKQRSFISLKKNQHCFFLKVSRDLLKVICGTSLPP